MARTAFVYHSDCELHDTGPWHPETVARARTIYEHVSERPLADSLRFLTPRRAEEQWIETVHAPAYRRWVEEACLSGRTALDAGDTHASEQSYEIALLAAGSALRAVDAVLADGFQAAFSCHRPPGHHARHGSAMGFCLFNHVAIAAKYAQVHHGLARIAIIDWDVHHGNGTQETFYEDPSVLFFSSHQYPFYPGTGGADERGMQSGLGSTLNVPLAPGSDGTVLRKAFDQQLRPALDRFKPELILISAGFDAHREDPLASIRLEDEDYAHLTRMVQEMAEDHAGGRIVSLLEGGYHLGALARAAYAHVAVLAGVSDERP